MTKIKSDVSTITPEMAEAFLKRNKKNRTVRQGNVDRWAAMMKNGEWRLTHQGIALDTNGDIVDGQHRLLAIVKSGCTIQMMVTHGLEPEAKAAIDIGAKRSTADMLHTSPMIAELCNFGARVATAEKTPSPAALETMYAGVGYLAQEIHQACSVKTIYFSSAPMRLAAIVRILEGEDKAFVLDLYTKLCRTDVENLTPAAQALVRLKLRNEVSASDKLETLTRGIHIFTKASSGTLRARKIDTSSTTERARIVLRKACGI